MSSESVRCVHYIEKEWAGHRVVLRRQRCKNRTTHPSGRCWRHRPMDSVLFPGPESTEREDGFAPGDTPPDYDTEGDHPECPPAPWQEDDDEDEGEGESE